MPPSPGRYRPFGSSGIERPRIEPSPAEALDRPLTVPLLVRGAADNRLLQALFWIAGGLFAVGLCAFLQHPARGGRVGALLFFAGAALAAAPAVGLLLYLLPRRLWLQVTVTGFVLTRPAGSESCGDEQVVGLSRDSSMAADGAVTHRVSLEVERGGEVERLSCRYKLSANTPDPLAAFWDRLAGRLARSAREALGRGEALAGPDWRLDAAGLHWRGEVTAAGRLRKVGYFDGRLCAWRDDEERPFLSLPRGGRNVQPLAVLLWELLQASPDANRPLPGRPLGRVILDRHNREWRVLLALALFFAPLMALVAGRLLLSPWPRQRTMGIGLAGLFAPILVAFLVLAVWSWRTRLRFHEYGLVKPGLWRTRVLMYDEIATMTCRGTNWLSFAPAPGSGRRPTIRYLRFGSGPDEGLKALRDHVAWLIGSRWAGQLEHAPVGWTLRLRFLPGGLEYRARQLFGLAPAVVVPYHYTHYALVGEEFHLHVQGGESPVCKESQASANFYPGLALLDMIYERLGADEDRSPAPRERPAAPGDETRIVGRDGGPGGVRPGA
jgi:hypothetical protein